MNRQAKGKENTKWKAVFVFKYKYLGVLCL